MILNLETSSSQNRLPRMLASVIKKNDTTIISRVFQTSHKLLI